MQRMITDAPLRQALRSAAMAKVERDFALDRNVAALADIFVALPAPVPAWPLQEARP